jgi:ABC-type lipoprotein release transport system permease subunit
MQVVAMVKGVPAAWTKVVNTDSLVVLGDKVLGDSGAQVAWLGEALLYKLNVGGDENAVNIMVPRRESVGVAQIDMLEQQVRVSAMVRPGDELSHKLLIIPMALAEELFERYGQLSSYELAVKDPRQLEQTQAAIQKQLGPGWKVQTRIQQNQAIYKMFNSEKWVAFAMVAFVLLLISFNLIGSLSMLVLEKKRDIRMLKFMGARDGLIRRIFYNQGLMAAMSGTGIGLGLGILAVWLQDKYGYITTSSTFINAYPVELRSWDLVLIFGLCAFLGVSGAILPALKSTEKLVPA